MLKSSQPRTGELDGISFKWVDRQKNGRVTACDSCHRKVMPKEQRMQYHDGNGKHVSKGTASSYWCTYCASSRGIRAPEKDDETIQEGLFKSTNYKS